jgi:hypothetical protein
MPSSFAPSPPASPLVTAHRERPAWLTALDGLCLPCADAEFYGTRIRHAECEYGGCSCQFTIPAEWPAGTWGAP